MTSFRGDGLTAPAGDALGGAHAGWVAAVAFSPDGSRMVSASQDLSLKLWDALGCTEIATLRSDEDGLAARQYSPDCARILTGSYDGTAKVWDAATEGRSPLSPEARARC